MRLHTTPAQRKRVKGKRCIRCGRDGADAAHLISRAEAPEHKCVTEQVVPLCRPCHIEYDSLGVNLIPFLEAHGYRDAAAAAVMAVGLQRAYDRLSGSTKSSREERIAAWSVE